MAKLYFRYGAMNSAKTLNLLAVAHNYEQQGKKILLMKPAFDSRWGAKAITSRPGLTRDADFVLKPNDSLPFEAVAGTSCVLVDESHFLAPAQVDALRLVASRHDVPVICYGLRTDFQTKLFPAAKRLMELCDAIEEIKTTCAHCNRKAIFNMRHSGGKALIEGPSLLLGAEDKYSSVCSKCYFAAFAALGYTEEQVLEALSKSEAQKA